MTSYDDSRGKLLSFALTLAFFLLATGVTMAQDTTVADRFENAARQNTLEAYVEFIATAPESTEAKQSYELIDKLFKNNLDQYVQTKESYIRSGWVGCSMGFNNASNISEISKWSRRIAAAGGPKAGSVPPSFCTKFKFKQTITNKASVPLLLLLGDGVLLEPGGSFTREGEQVGERCNQNSRAVAKIDGRWGVRQTCQQPLQAKGKITIAAVVPEAAEFYRAATENQDTTAARTLVTRFPHGQAAKRAGSKLSGWYRKARESVAEQVILNPNYEKGVSPVHENPYYLYVQNESDQLVVTRFGAENEGYYVFVKPKAYVAIKKKTYKGREADISGKTVLLGLQDFPRYLYADNGKGKILVIELDFNGVVNDLVGRVYFKDTLSTSFSTVAFSQNRMANSQKDGMDYLTVELKSSGSIKGLSNYFKLLCQTDGWRLQISEIGDGGRPPEAGIALRPMTDEQAKAFLAKFPVEKFDLPAKPKQAL